MTPSGILQCINLITQISTNPDDLIGVISDRYYFDFPIIRVNIQLNFTKTLSIPESVFDFYVFHNLSDSDIGNAMDHMIVLPWFYPWAKVLFIGTNFSSEMLKYIARYYIINVTFLDITSGIISTSYPYKRHNWNTIDTEISSIGSCDDNLRIMTADDLFPMKIPKIWKKSHIRLTFKPTYLYAEYFICETRYEGIEIEIFLLIFKHLKMRFRLEPTNNTVLAIGDVFIHKTDLTFGATTVTKWMRQTEITCPYLQDYIKWFIAPASEIPRWKYISTIFQKNVWFAFIITIPSVSVAWTLGNYLNDEKITANVFFEISLSPFVLFLGQSHRFFSKNVFHKILVLCIVFMSTMTNFFFGTRLAYLLNGRNYEFKIDNLEQLRKNSMYVGHISQIVKTWVTQTSALRDYPEYFYIDCSEKLLECIQRSKVSKDIALVGSERMIRQKAKTHPSNISLKTLNVHPQGVYIHASLSKGHPIFPLINRMLQYLVESGIITKISEKYHELSRINIEPLSSRQLNFEHLVFPLFIWTIGNILSMIVFYHEKHKSNNFGK
ncbi:hypothetical protein HHI36_007088 [Cryptolaemus montrouzieri]|uniref:Uncharacterized protein n=1 Tax=Cryptolaemus montrouzieri TaxID=559131 RepID=A0ABD2MNK1_9CUCU